MGQPRVPVVLAAFGEGPQRVTRHAIDPLGLGVGVFVAGRADRRLEPTRRVHSLNGALVHLGGSWPAASPAGIPSPERRAIRVSRTIRAASAAVSVARARVGRGPEAPEARGARNVPRRAEARGPS